GRSAAGKKGDGPPKERGRSPQRKGTVPFLTGERMDATKVPGRSGMTQGGDGRVGPAVQAVQKRFATRAVFQVPAEGLQTRLRQFTEVKRGQFLLARAIVRAHARPLLPLPRSWKGSASAYPIL